MALLYLFAQQYRRRGAFRWIDAHLLNAFDENIIGSMNEQKLQDTHTILVRWARRVAFGAWALASLSPGVAVALAQWASLAPLDDPTPYNTTALLIFCIGSGLALLGWLFWAIVHYRLRKVGYRINSTATGWGLLLSFFFWILLLIGGGILATVGGSSDSLAPLALLALGLGVSCFFGGLFGFIEAFIRIVSLGTRDSQMRRERLLEAARREGREVRVPTGWQLAPGLFGFIASGFLLLGTILVGAPLASWFNLPIVAVLAALFLIGALLCFFSLRALILLGGGENSPSPIPHVRAYALRVAAVVTVALLLVGILRLTRLAFLAVIPFGLLVYFAGRMRKRSGVHR